MSGPILVTGATGNVGREVVKALQAQGNRARATIRRATDVERVPEAEETVVFSFEQPGSYTAALDGVQRIFLMRPPAISNVQATMKPFIDEAVARGVEQIVFLSLIGVEERPYVPHYKVEGFLAASGAAYTLLRAGFFMQNLDTTHRLDIVEHDEIFIPAGRARTAFIDVRDIGAVAAAVLSSGEHDRRAYELTGGEALTYDEVAQIFSDVLGRPIRYADPALLRYVWRMRRRGYAWGYVLVTAALYWATRRGSAEKVTGDVARLLGRAPIRMQQYVRDYAAAWQKT